MFKSKKQNITIRNLFTYLIFAAFAFSCKPRENDIKVSDNNFQRTALLSHAADKLILPSYLKFQSEVNTLKTSVDSFVVNTKWDNFLKTREQWQKTIHAWQVCNAFNFGPATNFDFGTLLENIGTFPASSSKIEQYIDNKDFTLNNFARDSRGLFGIEYLIFIYGKSEISTNESFISFSYNGVRNEDRLKYLKAITDDVAKKTNQVVEEWQKTYKDKFVIDNSTNSTSAITLYYNAFLVSYENIKNFKIGIPAGKRAGQTKPEPSQIEGYISDSAMRYIQSNFATIVKIWKGTGLNEEQGVGFEEYIRSVEGGNNLANATSARFDEINSKISALENQDLKVLIYNNDPRISELYDLLTNSTRFIKSDLSSLLGLTITYSSGDGD